MDDRPILICYNDSEGARRAIDVAGRFFPGRRAVVLEVAPPLTGPESVATIGAVVPDFEELNTEDALARAKIGAERAREAGFVAEARADSSAPTWDGVVAMADEVDADLIVVGSRGLTGAQELLKGSFSHDVAEHAGRPVLIVPPPRKPSADGAP
jgi:nucleotide-binding universal stress UspA family protein